MNRAGKTDCTTDNAVQGAMRRVLKRKGYKRVL